MIFSQFQWTLVNFIKPTASRLRTLDLRKWIPTKSLILILSILLIFTFSQLVSVFYSFSEKLSTTRAMLMILIFSVFAGGLVEVRRGVFSSSKIPKQTLLLLAHAIKLTKIKDDFFAHIVHWAFFWQSMNFKQVHFGPFLIIFRVLLIYMQLWRLIKRYADNDVKDNSGIFNALSCRLACPSS